MARSAAPKLKVMNEPAATKLDKLLTMQEVVALLGPKHPKGTADYVRKLVKAGVLVPYQPAADVRPRYYLSQVEAILTPPKREVAK